MINIKRSQPAPECLSTEKLKKNGNYKCGDVEDRLQRDFHHKCYLCEEKYISSINVEHRVPHRGVNRDLMFDWNNLFWSCGHCNSTKSIKYENILDCTDDSISIVDLLIHGFEHWSTMKVEVKSLKNEPAVNETASLLNEIYNGTTNHKNKEADNLRIKLKNEIDNFSKLYEDYFFNNETPGVTKETLKIQIAYSLSFASAFAAFKIWIIKNNNRLYEEFCDLIPRIEN